MQNPPVFKAFRAFSPLLALVAAGLAAAVPSLAQTDPPASDYRARVLLRNLSNPTSIAFLPDGRVYVTRKNGTIRLVNPATGDTSTAANLPTANVREDGLHSLVLDPNFKANRWVYVLMSERSAGDTALVVARYTVDSASGVLQTASRATVLKFPVALNSTSAEHNTGTLAFGPDGNLYVGVADNTQHFYSGTGTGYAPRDTARPVYDAQRSAANTNDLRGKILRIRPEANGTYSIPAGNLKDSISHAAFNPNWNPATDSLSRVRPEIFLMGIRHPFRITVDPVTGGLYWAEPGPNASSDNATQGPRGYDVVGFAKSPGNYGWPYCRGNPYAIQKPSAVTTPYYCYTEYNYTGNGSAGPMYNPAQLRNTSKNNTGIVNLPPMRNAQVWYPYNSTGTAFPVFGAGGGGNAAMVGPVYRYNGALNSPTKLPKAFDRHLFIVEWQRSIVYVARLGESGSIDSIRTFRSSRDSVMNGPIDLKIGPDGALYLLNWVGNGYTSNSGNGTLTRLEYTGVHVGISRGDEPRAPAAGGSLYVFGPGASFRLPAGSRVAEFYSLRGEKLWSFRRADASRAENVRLPESVRGTVRARVR
jgi:cytochrome c